MSDNEEQARRSQQTFEYGISAIKHGVKDLKNFIVKFISYLETPVHAVAGIIETIIHVIIRIFSNYDELENDCNLSKEILEEIGNNKSNDQGILKRQIHNILSIPLTVIIMYNWLYLTCFKERIIINTTAEEWIKSLSNAMSAGAGAITGAISTASNVVGNAANAASELKDKLKDEFGSKEGEGEGEGEDVEMITADEGPPDEEEEEKKEEPPNDGVEMITADEGPPDETKTGGDGDAPAPAAEGEEKAAEGEEKAEGDAEKKPKSISDKLKKGYAAAMQGDPLSGWKVYAPLLHMIAPVSIFDKWIFGFFYIINTYVISPNLHPLLYYILFFKIFFDFVRNNQATIGKTLNDAIEYVFADEGQHPSITIPGSISQWSALFVTWSFASSIPEGVANISKEFWIVSVVKAFLFIISYVVIMVYIDQVCIYVILYLIYYSFFGIISFSKVGLFKMMHGMDMYFYKRIVGLQARGDRILNMTINAVFLFIFEIIILIFLIQGITDYLANIDAVELKITMALINVVMIYLLMKYCSYKFNTVWPSYKNDVKDENYNQIRKEYFNEVIPIESYADGANSYNYQDAANALSEYKFKTDWADWSKVASNTAKTLANKVISNPASKTLLTATNKIKEDLKQAKSDVKRKASEFKEAVLGKSPEQPATGADENENVEMIENGETTETPEPTNEEGDEGENIEMIEGEEKGEGEGEEKGEEKK